MSDTERELAAELEKILQVKPVQRPIERLDLPDVDEGDAMALMRRNRAEASSTEEELHDIEDAATFEWRQVGAAGSPVDSESTGRPDQSLQWIARARSDRRWRMARNALGWSVSIVVGVLVMGGAAWALTGWTPDLSGILAFGSAAKP